MRLYNSDIGAIALTILRAEQDLGPLTDGQRRDLCKDQHPRWRSELIDVIVTYIRTGVRPGKVKP